MEIYKEETTDYTRKCKEPTYWAERNLQRECVSPVLVSHTREERQGSKGGRRREKKEERGTGDVMGKRSC